MHTDQFQDYFSGVSANYARFRPAYPAGLFELIARSAPAHIRAWDCATGSGQAAVGLSPHFREVIATDASPQQIDQAAPIPNVTYRVASAESSGLASASVDAVTVAQALHWFDRDRFYAEVRRVATPRAVLAAWSYAGRWSFTPRIDTVTDKMHRLFLDYWPPIYTDLIEYMLHFDQPECQAQYFRALGFPFAALPVSEFQLVVQWNLDELIGGLATSSAAQRCLASTDRPKLLALFEELASGWGDPGEQKPGIETLAVRLGRVS
jgi:ubiquinone/menaquinone biosynthesis C-methylase UbiE